MKVQLNTGSIIEINRPQANLGSIVTAKKLQANIDGSIIDLWLPRGTTIDHSTPVQVVNAAYDTSGNGGRKLVGLSNGHLYAAARNSTTAWYIYVSTDNGGTWSQFKTVTEPVNDIALATNGTDIYAIISYSTSGAKCYSYNEAGTALVNGVTVDTSQSAMGLCSLAVDSSGNLHAAWASKNATYPNSFNIRYSKSTDGGATWAAPTQLTKVNTSGYIGAINPCLVINATGNPVIIVANGNKHADTYRVGRLLYNGSTWNYNNGIISDEVPPYYQSIPCAVVDSNGDIHVAWQGYDSTDTSKYNIRYSKSTDDGATWSAMEKLTSGNTVDRQTPSIAVGSSNVPFIAYDDNGTLKWIKYSGSWSSPETIATGTNPSVTKDITTFTKPVTLFDGGSDVKFYGVWTT